MISVSNQETILAHIRDKYKGKTGTQSLLDILRKKGELKYIPCQKVTRGDKEVDKHKYQVHAWKPFRLRCGVKSCSHNLYEATAFLYFSQLIAGGHVPQAEVGL